MNDELHASRNYRIVSIDYEGTLQFKRVTITPYLLICIWMVVVVDGLRSRGPKRLKPHFAMIILSLCLKYPTIPP